MNQPLGLWRRTMAALLDIVIVFLAGFVVLTSVVTPIYTTLLPEFVTNQQTFADYQLESFIYYENDENVIMSYPFDSYSSEAGVYDYSEAVYDYYAQFKNGKLYPASNIPFAFSIAWYNEAILNVSDSSSLFELNETLEMDVLATPKSSTTETNLKEFYFQAYSAANDDLLTYPPFKELRDELNWVIIQILLISISITVGIFYFAIPLGFGSGQTLMKRLFNIVVVNKQGFKINTSELLLRAIGTWISFVALAFTLEGTLLVVYAIMAFTPFNRAPHDFLAMTKVIDGRGIKLYANQTEQETQEKPVIDLTETK